MRDKGESGEHESVNANARGSRNSYPERGRGGIWNSVSVHGAAQSTMVGSAMNEGMEGAGMKEADLV